MSEEYCIFCGNAAIWYMVHGQDDESPILRGHSSPLCDSCKEAYEAGQASPTANAMAIDGWCETNGEVDDE